MNSGHTLAHYEIIRSLGKGGKGEVYLSDDIQPRPARGDQSAAPTTPNQRGTSLQVEDGA